MKAVHFVTFFCVAAVACAIATAGGPIAFAASHQAAAAPSALHDGRMISSMPSAWARESDDVVVAAPFRGLRTFTLGRRGKRGAIYARFSTRYQASIDDQIRACREWAEANDIDV